MKSSSLRLPRKPEARAEKIEELVERVYRGVVRVPRFQRGLRWESFEVEQLFDSIYRGYPIGSLLFYKRSAKAERLPVGPLEFEAPEISEAWWVVDGQQRVTTLTVCLKRDLPIPTTPNRQDPYVLYFDAQKQEFEPPPTSGRIPTTWVPLPNLLDATRLSEWVFGWHHGKEEALRRIVFEAGTRIREYPIPLYLIETKDDKVARDIFYRINKTGKALDWTDVYNALFGDEVSSPSTLEELSEEMTEVGMGRLDEKRLLICLVALRGKDPTRTLQEHLHRDPEVLRDAVQEALPVLRHVLSFLRQDAGIPHVRLLPKSILLDVLTRFFVRNENPKARTRLLLVRWFWRIVFGAGIFDDRTLRRRGISAVGSNEEKSVQQLLGLLHREIPRPLELPPSFDARADDSRIALLTLAHLGPRDLRNGQRIDIARQLEEEDKGAFVKILKQAGLELSRSPANRIIQAKGTPIRPLLLNRISKRGIEDPVLTSHAIDPEAAKLLAADDLDGFLARRAETLTQEVRRFGERMASWGHSDRPSIEGMLAESGAGP